MNDTQSQVDYDVYDHMPSIEFEEGYIEAEKKKNAVRNKIILAVMLIFAVLCLLGY